MKEPEKFMGQDGVWYDTIKEMEIANDKWLKEKFEFIKSGKDKKLYFNQKQIDQANRIFDTIYDDQEKRGR